VVVEQRPVERVGMVVVDGPALLDRRVAQVEVVRVEFDQGQVVGAGEGDTRRSVTVVLPELLPPAIPIMNGRLDTLRTIREPRSRPAVAAATA
jgi:hypothetical protein